MPPSEEHRQVMRTFSQKVFGNKETLLVAAAAATCGSEQLYSTGLAAVTGLAQPRVGSVLNRLEQAGLIEAQASDPPAKKLYTRDLEHPFWSAAVSLARHLTDDAFPDSGETG